MENASARKQNQLYPMLEDHGFDRPTRIMWTFDDGVRDAISASYALHGRINRRILSVCTRNVREVT